MDEKKICLHVLLLLNVVAVSSYLQFVVPGRTEADSSPVHISQLDSGPYPYLPNRTVDGNFSQSIRTCLHTAVSGVTEAWLQIDLQTLTSVKYVKFWYRNDKGSVAQNTIRLRGYSIRVSNTSDVPPGSTYACFTDDMSHILPTVIQEDCKKTARYVWFYQPKVRSGDDRVPILEICEVQIFECISGLYGNECNFNCSQFCHDQLCYGPTGECVNGCRDGYIGGLCKTRCPNGYFGRKCLKTCGKCLDDQTCDNVNGTCMDGCNEGLKGDICKTGSVGSTQDPTTPFIAVIGILVVIVVVLITIIAVGVVILRNARKTNKANSKVNEIDMYDSPTAKPENNVYDVISTS